MAAIYKDISSLVSALALGDRKALARAITMVENDSTGASEILKLLPVRNVPVIGFTGPPGAGKSTLINAFLRLILNQNLKAAVIAVDPTSPFNFGSLLGDRIRMSEHFNDERIFIRSVATRGSLGGLSEKIIEITDMLRAADFDFILIETVGVGQSEVEIAGLADTTVVVIVPEAGDDIQTIKSGIMEVADIFAVNKSDREGADILAGNLKKMLAHRQQTEWQIPVINLVATTGKGIEELFDNIAKHRLSIAFNEKKYYLLGEKAWKLICNKRMSDIRRDELRELIKKEIHNPEFNLYRFIEKF